MLSCFGVLLGLRLPMAVSNGSDDDDDVIFSGSLSPAALYTCFSIRPYCRTTFGKLNNV